MDINYFKDILFDLLNESNELNIKDIQCDDNENRFEVITADGAAFVVTVEKAE